MGPKDQYNIVLEKTLHDLKDAYTFALKDYQVEMTIKILPGGKVFFISLSKSQKTEIHSAR